MVEIEGAIGRQFQSLSIVFVCAVNTKLASLFEFVFSLHEARWYGGVSETLNFTMFMGKHAPIPICLCFNLIAYAIIKNRIKH